MLLLFFIYDEKVTLRKEYVLGHFAATEAYKQSCIYFASSCSSEMAICSFLVALKALSFSPSLMTIVCFCSTGFNPFLLLSRCNKLQGCP